MTPSACRWRLYRRAELHWRHFDGEWVVFEAGSGDTHQLDAISAAVLMCLESEPQGIEELSQIIAAELSLKDCDGLTSRIGDVVDQFTRIGLIEPVSP